MRAYGNRVYEVVSCPHCGNEITVNSDNSARKCPWCKRIFYVECRKIKNKKYEFKLKPIEFNEETKEAIVQRKVRFWKEDNNG